MLLPWISIVFLVPVFWKSIYGGDNSFSGRVASTIVLCIFMFLAFIFGAAVALGIGYTLPKRWVAIHEDQLVSLSHDAATDQDIFISIRDSDKGSRYLFCKEGYGRIFESVPVGDNAMVFEIGRTGGGLKTYERQFVYSPLRWIAIAPLRYQYEFSLPYGGLKKNVEIR